MRPHIFPRLPRSCRPIITEEEGTASRVGLSPFTGTSHDTPPVARTAPFAPAICLRPGRHFLVMAQGPARDTCPAGAATVANPAHRWRRGQARFAAAEELRQFDPLAFPEMVPALLDALKNDTKPSVRSEAVQTLGRLRPVSQQIGQALEQARDKDPSMRVRLQARRELVSYRWGAATSRRNPRKARPPGNRRSLPPAARPGREAGAQPRRRAAAAHGDDAGATDSGSACAPVPVPVNRSLDVPVRSSGPGLPPQY